MRDFEYFHNIKVLNVCMLYICIYYNEICSRNLKYKYNSRNSVKKKINLNYLFNLKFVRYEHSEIILSIGYLNNFL